MSGCSHAGESRLIRWSRACGDGVVEDALVERLELVSWTWEPHQRLHVGNVAWASVHGDGSPAPSETLSWGEPMFAFAEVWRSTSSGDPCEVSVHVSPRVSAEQRVRVITDLIEATPLISMEVSRQHTALVGVLLDSGFHRTVSTPLVRSTLVWHRPGGRSTTVGGC